VTTLAGGRIVASDGIFDGGWIRVEDGRIAALGRGVPPTPAVDLAGAWLLPGFIDLHMHGGGGFNATKSPADMAAAVAFHRRHGTTRTLVSLVTAPLDALVVQLAWVADMVEAGAGPNGHVIGAHLEGPFLSHSRCGAQNPEHLLGPDRAAFARLVAAARGTLRTVTIAPELPGALALIGDILACGAVAAIGHTDADFAEAGTAIDAGASLVTHLFNAMRPLHHREPGVIAAALAANLACEVINDGVHLHPAVTALVAQAPHRLVLITDAIEAAGVGDGDFVLGDQDVRVSDGKAVLAGTATLAGSTLTMDEALRRAVRQCGLRMEVASAAASGNPARVLGIDGECGSIAVGLAADLVVLDDQLNVRQVLSAGQRCLPDELD